MVKKGENSEGHPHRGNRFRKPCFLHLCKKRDKGERKYGKEKIRTLQIRKTYTRIKDHKNQYQIQIKSKTFITVLSAISNNFFPKIQILSLAIVADERIKHLELLSTNFFGVTSTGNL